MKEKYFKVKYGFNISDQVSIGEDEIEKAIYAQIKGQPVQLKNSYINGKNIISITPHWHKHTGWYEWYEPKDGEDFKQIQRDCPSYDGWIEYYKKRVSYFLEMGKPEMIGKNYDLPHIEKPEVKMIENHTEGGMKSIGEIV